MCNSRPCPFRPCRASRAYQEGCMLRTMVCVLLALLMFLAGSEGHVAVVTRPPCYLYVSGGYRLGNEMHCLQVCSHLCAAVFA